MDHVWPFEIGRDKVYSTSRLPHNQCTPGLLAIIYNYNIMLMVMALLHRIETSGSNVNPAAACASGIVARSTGAVLKYNLLKVQDGMFSQRNLQGPSSGVRSILVNRWCLGLNTQNLVSWLSALH